VEHIIPESLGNTKYVLPPGVVCDSCNNYFAREVEKPFIESPSISLMRFHQGLVSKRGRVPPATGFIMPGGLAVVRRSPKYNLTSVEVSPDVLGKISQAEKGALILPMDLPSPEAGVVSRFLAKAALESMARRLLSRKEGLAYLVDEFQLDTIRDHARRGSTPDWPTHTRRIYDANARSVIGSSSVQVVHEEDFLVTQHNEWYFVLALFGQEYVINIGGPDIDGYLHWLEENDNVSPLYHGKNSSVQPKPQKDAD
jgi:HNH endonuclease